MQAEHGTYLSAGERSSKDDEWDVNNTARNEFNPGFLSEGSCRRIMVHFGEFLVFFSSETSEKVAH